MRSPTPYDTFSTGAGPEDMPRSAPHQERIRLTAAGSANRAGSGHGGFGHRPGCASRSPAANKNAPEDDDRPDARAGFCFPPDAQTSNRRLRIMSATTATPLLRVRVRAENPNHHLWNNHGTWFLHYTVHPTPFTKERVRRSLGTPLLEPWPGNAATRSSRTCRRRRGRRRRRSARPPREPHTGQARSHERLPPIPSCAPSLRSTKPPLRIPT